MSSVALKDEFPEVEPESEVSTPEEVSKAGYLMEQEKAAETAVING